MEKASDDYAGERIVESPYDDEQDDDEYEEYEYDDYPEPEIPDNKQHTGQDTLSQPINRVNPNDYKYVKFPVYVDQNGNSLITTKRYSGFPGQNDTRVDPNDYVFVKIPALVDRNGDTLMTLQHHFSTLNNRSYSPADPDDYVYVKTPAFVDRNGDTLNITNHKFYSSHEQNTRVNPDEYEFVQIPAYVDPNGDQIEMVNHNSTGPVKSGPGRVTRENSYFKTSIGVKAGSGSLSGNEYSGIHFTELYLSIQADPKIFVRINLSYAYAPVSETHRYAHSIQNSVKLAGAGIEIYYYFTPPYTLMGYHVYAGISREYMYWKYRNAVIIEDTNGDELFYQDEIKWDLLGGFNLYTGTGLNLLQTSDIDLGVFITPGIIVWDPTTLNKFDNDVFKPFLYIKLGLMIGFNINRNNP